MHKHSVSLSLWDAQRSTTDQNVSFVREGFFSFLGNEQQLVEEEERSFIFGSLQTKCSFKDQLSVANQIRALPVGQQTLDFLREAPNCMKMREANS